MPLFVSALSALAVVSFALATPVRRANKTFTIYENVPKPFVPGPVLSLKAYQKYWATPPPHLLAAAADSTVIATPAPDDLDYLCPVTIGGQTLNLDFDTGSADLWVFSTELPEDRRGNHLIYDPAMSTTAQLLPGDIFRVTYGDGSSASGIVYADVVDVGGTSVVLQPVELAQLVSDGFVNGLADGMLGLAFSSLNNVQPQSVTTFFQSAITQGLLQEHLFTADLKKGMPGSYDFGFIDPNKYIEPITYVPVDNEKGFWQVIGSGYAVGEGDFQEFDIDAITDTSTYLLYLNNEIVDAYYDGVPGAGYSFDDAAMIFPCSEILPDLTLGFDDWNAVIPGDYLNTTAAEEEGFCYGGLQSDEDLPFSVFGVIFIKSQFLVFDSGNMRLGVAAKNL